MRKGRDGGNGKKSGGKKKRLMKIVATTSLPAVDRPNTDQLECRPLVPCKIIILPNFFGFHSSMKFVFRKILLQWVVGNMTMILEFVED